jgi:uncharacterized protein
MSSEADLWVALMRLDLSIPGSRSLKDRRQVVKSLRDRLISRFNVSCADVSGSESWGRATLGLAAVSNDRGFLESLCQEIERYAHNDPGALTGRLEKEIFHYEGT